MSSETQTRGKPIDWHESTYSREDFINDFNTHRGLIRHVAIRYFRPDDIEDGISDFFLAMIDPGREWFREYDHNRGRVNNWLAWQARSFFGRKRKSQKRYTDRLHKASLYCAAKSSANPFAGAEITEQVRYAYRRLDELDQETYADCVRTGGNRQAARAASNMATAQFNRRIQSIRKTFVRYGVSQIA